MNRIGNRAPNGSSSSPLPTVIVLASGRGERFRAAGGRCHKLQAILSGTPVLEHTLAAVRVSRLPWHLEDVGHPGMADSIAAAVRATADAAGWLILPADLPLVQATSLQAVAAALPLTLAMAAVQPSYHGQRGHPVAFSAACFKALSQLAGEQGAAPVLRALRAAGLVLELALEDVGIVTDIDTPNDLSRAELLMRSGSHR